MARILVLTALLCAFANVAAQPVDPLPNAINRTGEQRMLAQRIAKSYAQIGLNVLPLAATHELEEAMNRFESNLSILDATANGNDTRASLENLRAAWTPFRKAARGQPSREAAIWLSHQADIVLAAAEAHLRNLQNTGRSAAGRLVAQAGRQRMLSQRIAKAYLLISWGDHSEVTREELDAAVNEFSGALAALRQRGENTAEIGQELEEMSQHWLWLQSALAAEGASSYRLIVTEATEAILGSADRITRLYEHLPR